MADHATESNASAAGSKSPRPRRADQPPTVKVAIIGGGCAGLATAWQLSKLNLDREAAIKKEPKANHRKLPVYEIAVYEASWRLGGKGASVRDAHGRILEHGLHVWLGFYENAFRMMRECFDSLRAAPALGGKPLLIRTFEQAFVAEPHIGVASRRLRGDWEVWSAFLPPMKGQPGDPIDETTNPFTWWGYLARSLALAKALMQSVLAPATQRCERRGPGTEHPIDSRRGSRVRLRLRWAVLARTCSSSAWPACCGAGCLPRRRRAAGARRSSRTGCASAIRRPRARRPFSSSSRRSRPSSAPIAATSSRWTKKCVARRRSSIC